VYSTRVSAHLNAPRPAVYQALLDADAVAKWRVPEGMTGQVHEFDAREADSVPTADNETGTRMALANLASLVEAN
jgi:uncharacterized protein YndB with AHSA1/START domain